MKRASAADVQANFREYLSASKREPIVVTNNGKTVAVLVAADDDDLERLRMADSPELQAILAAARKRFREGKGIPHDDFWQEVRQEHAAKKISRPPRKKNSPAR